MNTGKPKWVRPQLVVLGRGKPEENVLAACKNPSSHTGPSNNNCKNPGQAEDCSIVAPS